MPDNENGRPLHHQGTGPETQMTTALAAESIAPERAGLPLLAAAVWASAQAVTAVSVLPLDVVQFVDAPSATALEVVFDLAVQGVDPAADLVSAELLRRGMLDGHHGRLVKDRLLDAVDAGANPAALARYAADLAALVWRVRMAAAGEAIQARAVAGAEDDAWSGFVAAGVELRKLRDVVLALRGLAGQVSAA